MNVLPMDPKQQLNKLDPKLQDAYNRVMGTPTIPVPTPPQSTATVNQTATGITPPVTAAPVSTTPVPTSPVPAHAIPVATNITPTQPIMHVEEVKNDSPSPMATHPADGMHPIQPIPTPTPVTPVMHPQQPAPVPPAAPTMHPMATPAPTMHPTMTTAAPPTISSNPAVHPAMGVSPMASTTPVGVPGVPATPAAPIQPGMHAVPPQMPNPIMGTPAQPQPAAGDQAFHATVPLTPAAAGAHVSPQTHGFVSPKKKSKISPVILIVGAIVFLLAYTVFWVKFFNVPIPFLSQ